MVPISNTGSVPKTDLVLAFRVHRVQFFHMAGHFTRKCFYFMIFDCYKLKLSVSKNWQLFSNFNTRQFWSQKQLKTNWAHFSEHKERPQCANIWQSLPCIDIFLEFWRFCQSSEHRFPPCLHAELPTTCYNHSIVTYKFQYSWIMTCLNFAGTGSRLYVAFVMTWYLAFTTSGRTAEAVRPVISGKLNW